MIQERKTDKLIALILLFAFFSCNNTEIRDIKFKVRDELLDCKGIYNKEVLKNVTCFYDNGKVKLVKEMSETSDSSTYIFYYRNGTIKEKGMHVGSNPTGIWLSYFENGKLSTFNYFEIIHDSSFIIQ